MGRIGTIINRKGKQDARKAKIFTKHARNITVAAKEGGGDPEYNAKLAVAIDKAKSDNMPNDNIDKAIKKGCGETDGADFTELTYEGYGPCGSAFIVECLTDNLNRTASNIRSYFTKIGGSLGKNGEVSFMFDRKGVLVIDTEGKDPEEIEMDIIEAGAEDFEAEENHYEIYTELSDFGDVRNSLKEKSYTFKMAELRYLPQSMVQVKGDDNIKMMNKLLDLFDDDDDVQNVYYNCEEA